MAQLACAQYRCGGFEVSFSPTGVVNISYAGATVATVVFVVWGPNWHSESGCGAQDGWSIVEPALTTETTVSASCYTSCSYARVAWHIKT